MRIFFLLIFSAFLFPCMAQVGIGTNNPSSSAVLDISSTTKGLLPPRLNMQQIKNINAPEAGLIVYNTDQNKPCYFNGTEWLHYDNSLVMPKVGFYHALAGGIVVYVDASGLHGLAASMADVGTGGTIQYGCSGTNIPGAQFSAIGTGQSNTNAINASCFQPGIAAKLCDDLVSNGFSDWYLPSIDELSLLYVKRDSLPGISTGRYWSSTQVNASMAQMIDFSTGQTMNLPPTSLRYARAIRTF